MKRPDYDCSQAEIVAALAAIGLFITGVVIAVLSLRDWKWM